MKRRGFVVIIPAICLIISMKLFWNLAIFSDEKGISPNMVLGGDFWLYMDWLKLFLLLILCVLPFLEACKISFIISSICLIISTKLFWSMYIFSSKTGTSLINICGGEFWFYMNWLIILLLFILCILTFSLKANKKRQI